MKLIELANPFASDYKFMKNLFKLIGILVCVSIGSLAINDYVIKSGVDLSGFFLSLFGVMTGMYVGMCVQFSRQSTADGSMK